MGRPSLMVNWMLESVDGTPQPDGELDARVGGWDAPA